MSQRASLGPILVWRQKTQIQPIKRKFSREERITFFVSVVLKSVENLKSKPTDTRKNRILTTAARLACKNMVANDVYERLQTQRNVKNPENPKETVADYFISYCYDYFENRLSISTLT